MQNLKSIAMSIAKSQNIVILYNTIGATLVYDWH